MPSDASTPTGTLPVLRRPVAREEFFELDPPGPGQYWRLSRDLGAVSTSAASHPQIKAGTVLLIKEVEAQVDGTPHAIHLAPHPDWYQGPGWEPLSPTFMYDDFLDLWARAPDAESVRAAEMAALQDQMAEVQRAMLSPPPAPAVDGLLRHDPVPNAGGDARGLATTRGLADMAAHAEATRVRAEEQVAWITSHTATLGAQTHKLARYHQERAEAMLAIARTRLKGLEKIHETVRNLKLYTGEDVSFIQVCQGDPAPPSEGFTLYQDLLSLDEELLIHLDGGGLSHHDVDALPAILSDPAIADRLIPARRGFVLCRFRATDKAFFSAAPGAGHGEVLAAALANAAENDEARQTRLLYRDGARFYIISCPEVLKGISQLMPSKGEQDSYYRRKRRPGTTAEDGARITPGDLDYAQAQRRQLGVLNDYARVLVICWGLHDRTDLFESTDLPRFTNWLDPSFQASRLSLVSQDSLLGEEREDYGSYRRRVNDMVCPGATVVLDTRVDRDHAHAPALFGQPVYDAIRGENVRQPTHAPLERFVIGRVRSTLGRPYLEVPAKSTRYGSQRTITAKWYLDKGDPGFLVLDRLHAPDLSYYLASRRERRNYADFVPLFRAARDFVAARDAAEAPIRAFLRAAVASSGLPCDPDGLEANLTTAIATWRTSRSKGDLVLPGAEGWTGASQFLLNVLHSAVSTHVPRVAAIEDLCRATGRSPLRLVHRGNDTWHLYSLALDAERDPRVGDWPWVTDVEVAFSPDGRPVQRGVASCLLRKAPGEIIIHDWPLAVEYEQRAPSLAMSLSSILSTLDAAEAAAAQGGFTHPLPPDGLLDLAKSGLAWSRRQPGGFVIRPQLVLPLGTLAVDELSIESSGPSGAQPGFRRSGETPFVLMAQVDLWAYCLAHAQPSGRAAIEEVCVSHYKDKACARKVLATLAKDVAFTPCAMSLAEYQGISGSSHALVRGATRIHLDGTLAASPWFFGVVSGHEEKAWRQAFGSLERVWQRKLTCCRITTLNAFGATLFPVLAAACDGPAREKPLAPSPKPRQRR